MATGKIMYRGYEIIKGKRKYYIYFGDELVGEAIAVNEAKGLIWDHTRPLRPRPHP